MSKKKPTSFRCRRCGRMIRIGKKPLRSAIQQHMWTKHKRAMLHGVKKKVKRKPSKIKAKPLIKKTKSVRRKPTLLIKPMKLRAPSFKAPFLKLPALVKPKRVKILLKTKPKRKPTHKPMTKALQVHVIKKGLKRRGIEPDLVDVTALTDSTLRLDENMPAVLASVGKREAIRPEEGREPEAEEFSESMIGDAKERVARGENGHLKGFVEGYEYRKTAEEYH